MCQVVRVTARGDDVAELQTLIDACFDCLTRATTTASAQQAIAVVLATVINTHDDVDDNAFVQLTDSRVPSLVEHVDQENGAGIATAVVWCAKAAMVCLCVNTSFHLTICFERLEDCRVQRRCCST